MEDRRMEQPERESAGEEPADPTIDADEADPGAPGPGDSEGARPEPDPTGEDAGTVPENAGDDPA